MLTRDKNMIFARCCLCAIVFILIILTDVAYSIASQNAKPMSLGLYGTHWLPWMLDLPEKMDFVIYQVTPSRSVNSVRDALQAAQKIHAMVILDILFYEDQGQRTARAGSKPLKSVEEYESLFSRLLAPIRGLAIEAVTIEEENVYWRSRASLLTTLYSHLKVRYPWIQFYQWYSWSRKINIPGRSWPALPADGWVIDPYGLTGPDYKYLVEGMTELKKPIISIVWSSPNWRVGDNEKNHNPIWWNEEGWKTFYWQVAVNRQYNLLTAFFAFWVTENRENRVLPVWMVTDKCARQFLEVFTDRTVPFIKGAVTIPLEVPKVRPEWISGLCS